MQHQNLFVFDIETICDINSARKLLGLENATPREVQQAITQYHLDLTDQKNPFLTLSFQGTEYSFEIRTPREAELLHLMPLSKTLDLTKTII